MVDSEAGRVNEKTITHNLKGGCDSYGLALNFKIPFKKLITTIIHPTPTGMLVVTALNLVGKPLYKKCRNDKLFQYTQLYRSSNILIIQRYLDTMKNRLHYAEELRSIKRNTSAEVLHSVH